MKTQNGNNYSLTVRLYLNKFMNFLQVSPKIHTDLICLHTGKLLVVSEKKVELTMNY